MWSQKFSSSRWVVRHLELLSSRQNALQSLTSAIAKNDWESASRACRRAMDVRKEVIEGGFAGAVVVCLPPSASLTTAYAPAT